jgi:hypothetical protein
LKESPGWIKKALALVPDYAAALQDQQLILQPIMLPSGLRVVNVADPREADRTESECLRVAELEACVLEGY